MQWYYEEWCVVHESNINHGQWKIIIVCSVWQSFLTALQKGSKLCQELSIGKQKQLIGWLVN